MSLKLWIPYLRAKISWARWWRMLETYSCSHLTIHDKSVWSFTCTSSWGWCCCPSWIGFVISILVRVTTITLGIGNYLTRSHGGQTLLMFLPNNGRTLLPLVEWFLVAICPPSPWMGFVWRRGTYKRHFNEQVWSQRWAKTIVKCVEMNNGFYLRVLLYLYIPCWT